ncbi:TIGR01459 family HAD-type hydrolase [Yoonia sp. F2084L]|uniref:TIGR01459 family HAD-type hydrolase n=1 Tax=Yoonia sp. F2084L TaxID=2926419 RepID=UPI001FF44EB3|nr:TIGR01459 family HAD-type hydrolase [Yoonia sp. F2084L]
MTQQIASIAAIAGQFDAIVLDQWGVLHDGSNAYELAQATVDGLHDTGMKLGVLSNSGKRAAPNAARIATMGFDAAVFDCVMTSGEALWQVFSGDSPPAARLYPIEGQAGDAAVWAAGLTIDLVDTPALADAILLMGLPDGTGPDDYDGQLTAGLKQGLPLYCSNPDLTSPRGGGTYVMSPGALAHRYRDMGGTVYFYGKPHLPIFAAMQAALGCPPERILMVGDSLHHDILGAQTAGWGSLLICAGVHAPDLSDATLADDLDRLAQAAGMAAPDYALPDLR